MTDLPWKMGGTFSGQPNNAAEPHPLDVTFYPGKGKPTIIVFRKCCGCMAVSGHSHNHGEEYHYKPHKGEQVEFVCGCGSHPSVMVCDGKVIGTSA